MAEKNEYPVDIKREDDSFVVRFPDLDGAITGSTDLREALKLAQNCLETWLSTAMIKRWDIPPPSPARGRPTIAPGVKIAAKLALDRTMLEKKIGNVALAKMIGCDEAEVRHMRNPHRATKITRIEEALRHLDVQLIVATQKYAA